MSEDQTNFKVTDRRLFNPDGSARDVPPEEKPEAPRQAKPEPTAATKTPEPAVASPAATKTPESAVASPAAQSSTAAETPSDIEPEVPAESQSQPLLGADESEEDELLEAEDPASFANFLMSIASNAAASLGMIEHPVTGKRDVELEVGKHWIDILGMLQQKTSGNLLPHELQVLEGLLAELRMQFVSLTNAAPKVRKFSGSDITGGR